VASSSNELILNRDDTHLTNVDAAGKFLQVYVEEITKLNELSINGYEEIFINFQKLLQDLKDEQTTTE
jgi:hypothetical protein